MADDDLFGAPRAGRAAPAMGRRRGGGAEPAFAEAPPPVIADDFDDSSDEDASAPAPARAAAAPPPRHEHPQRRATAPAPPPAREQPAPPRGGLDRAGGIAADFDDASPTAPRLTGVSRRAAAQRQEQARSPVGWGDDDDPAAAAPTPSGDEPIAPRDRAAARHDAIERSFGDDDIPTIPDLADADDDVAGGVGGAVAAAPRYAPASNFRTLGELDEETGAFRGGAYDDRGLDDDGHDDEDGERGGGGFSAFGGGFSGEIDLSLLTSALIPRELCVEPDEEWDPDTLWNEIKSELIAEREAKARAREGGEGGSGGSGGFEDGGDPDLPLATAAARAAAAAEGGLDAEDFASPKKEKKKKSILGRMGSKIGKMSGKMANLSFTSAGFSRKGRAGEDEYASEEEEGERKNQYK